MGYKYENEAEQRVYRTMKKNEADRKMIAADLVVAYCEDKGIEWGTIKVTDITEYNNTADSAEGHFVIGAVVTKRVKG